MGGRISLRGWRSSRTSKKPLQPIPDASVAISSPATVHLDPSLSPSPLPSMPATQLVVASTTSTTTVVQVERTGLIHLNKDTPIPDTYSEGTFPIDIIAVHGLNGGAYSTWTHANNTFWLRDLLTKELPGARIYSFGYEAKVFRSLGTGGFEDFARQLLESIRSERGTPALKRRPIIFVCHSMGGIVVKKALNITVFDKKRFSSIAAATVGILFLATPHGGSAAASTGAAVARLSNVPFMGRMQVSNANLVTSLKLDSKELQNIAREFRHLTKDIDIYSFLEQEIIPGVGIIVDQKSGSMNVDREVVIPMGGCDHRSICRFEGESSVGYKLVLAILKEAAVEVTNKVHAELQEEDWPCLQSLSFPGVQQRTAGQNHHPRTCEWLPQHPTYKVFISPSSHKSLLLVKGLPGSGKSTLMSSLYIAYYKQPSHARDICLSFFFRGNGSMLQRSKLGMLRSLLWQMYQQSVDARNVIFAKWKGKQAGLGSQWMWIVDELCELLTEVLCRQHREVMLFVDAVDEAVDESGTKSGTDILTYLRQLNLGVQDAGRKIRICVSCRHYPVFTSGPDTSEIVVEESNTPDLVRFVKSQLQNGVQGWSHFAEDERTRLEEAIVRTAAGVFLWAELRLRKIVKHLNDGAFEIADISSLVETESNELFAIYQSILENEVDDDVKKKALLFMQWVCLAERPLTVEELRFAMASDDLVDHSPSKCEELMSFVQGDERMARLVLSLSGGLAILDVSDGKRSTIQLFHATVYEFMRTQGLESLSAPLGLSPQGLQTVLGASQDRLSKSCLKYLAQDDLIRKANMDFKMTIKECPFTEYATINWPVHAERAEQGGVNQEHIVDFLEAQPDFFKIWKMLFYALPDDPRDPKCPDQYKFFLIHLASSWNLQTMVAALLRYGVSIDEADGCGFTPLHHACENGYVKLSEFLIEKGASMTEQTALRRTALECAASNGHEKIVRLLIKKGADVNIGSVLQAAAQEGNFRVVAILIRNGANVNAQGGRYGNALKNAAYEGHLDVVKLLLANNADITQEGGMYGTALHTAVRRSREKSEQIVQLLLDAGANPNTYGCDVGNAFQGAAHSKQLGIMKMFLEHGAEIDSVGKEYGTALSVACGCQCEEIVEFLLSSGAKVNIEGGRFGNALQAAAHIGNVEVVRMILDNGGDVHAVGGHFGCVLQAGAASPGPEVVPLLRAAGAVDVKGGYFGNVLQAAIDARNFELAKEFLRSGSDINEVGGLHGTALQAAVVANAESFVAYLLDAGADVNIQGGHHHTALQAAVVYERESIVRLLISRGAQVNAIVSGNFALQAAARRREIGIVQLLLDGGAQIDLHGGDWQGTALYEAVASDNIPITALLLDRGARSEGKAGFYNCVFDAATGSLNMNNFLLSRGLVDKRSVVNQPE